VLADVNESSPDDFLSEDEFEFQDDSEEGQAQVSAEREAQTNIVEPNTSLIAKWMSDIQIRLQGDARYNFSQHHSQLRRASLGIKYETAPFRSAYIKLDSKYSYFNQDDYLVTDSESYGALKLNALWLQYSVQNCAIKLGQQGVFWGVVEGTYAVDLITPLDTTEPLLTDFSELRSSQNLALLSCYQGDYDFDLFYSPKALLDRHQHTNRSALRSFEKTLNDEYGARVSKHWEGLDLSFVYARLYGNSPLLVPDPSAPLSPDFVVPRFDFYGLSSVWAIERLLLKADIGYSRDQLIQKLSARGSDLLIEESTDISLGLEYTTDQSHDFSMAFWHRKLNFMSDRSQDEYDKIWFISWSKKYFSDTLTSSLLGYWLENGSAQVTTLLQEYQIDDQWTISGALQFGESEQVFSGAKGESELALYSSLKVQF